MSSEALALRVKISLDDMKGEDIVMIDVREKSSIADFMIVVSGGVARKVMAMADRVCDVLREDAGIKPKVEGKDKGDWVVVDGGDVVVHLQRPEVRAYYRIEDIWSQEDRKQNYESNS